MMYSERCPHCGELNIGLFLKETDGWFICEKCGGKVCIYTEGIKRMAIPLYTMEQLTQMVRKEKEKRVAMTS